MAKVGWFASFKGRSLRRFSTFTCMDGSHNPDAPFGSLGKMLVIRPEFIAFAYNGTGEMQCIRRPYSMNGSYLCCQVKNFQ